mmetsp:Transcript_38426/g.70481  ORF Transcript_38426/g.70481 Transcript_38426/m.70481 type:complete len:130 (-) Transcript_38426:94-483(-)
MADHPRPPGSHRQGRSWMAILNLPASREVVDGQPRRRHGDCGRPSLSSQRHGRSWPAMLVLSWDVLVDILVLLALRPRHPSVTAGPGRHPRPLSVAASRHHPLFPLHSGTEGVMVARFTLATEAVVVGF